MRNRRDAIISVALSAAMLSTFVPTRAFADAAAQPSTEPLQIVTSYLKGATLRAYGFVETDAITDTTQGFTEEPDNNLVPQRQTGSATALNYAGSHGREMMSVRNSRLGLELTVPETDGGIKTRAVFEMDFLGNQGVSTTPGSTSGTQSEANYFNNPTARIRHAYVDVTDGELDAKIGQTWSLLGWQPYYFPGESIVLPSPGMLYRRFPQFRATDTQHFGDWTMETAIDAAKPAEMNSQITEEHAGLRLASTKYLGASSNGAGTTMVGLSAAVSAALIPVRTNNGNANGSVVAFDFLVPIIPSADGKDRTNNLVWVGEMSSGFGDGGLEYAGLASGLAAVPSSALEPAIDAGIASLNSSGYVQLLQYRVFRTNLQYSLNNHWSASAGYAQVEARNLGSFATAATQAPKIQYGYAGVMWDPLAWLRFGGEINQTKDTYNAQTNYSRFAYNNRYQLSAYFKF